MATSRNQRSGHRSRSAAIISTGLSLCAASLAPLVESSLASPVPVRREGLWTRQQRQQYRAPSPVSVQAECIDAESDAAGDDFLSEDPSAHNGESCSQSSQEDGDSQESDYTSYPFLAGVSSDYESEEQDFGRDPRSAFDFGQATATPTTPAQPERRNFYSEFGRSYSSSSSSSSRTHQHGHPFFNAPHHQASGVATRSRKRPRGSAAPLTAEAFGGLARLAAGAAVVLAAGAPLAQALSSHWPYFVAGGVCAAVSHTAAVPLDVIKTRIQCAEPGEYSGTWDALVRICRSEGAQVLFCGAGATLVGYAMQGFLKFGFFEFLKPFFSALFARGGNGGAVSSTPVLGSLVAASIAAEMVGSSALTPLEAARIRMVADADYAPGLRSGIARMISEEGLGALTRGLPAVLAKQIPYTVTKLVTFDVLVRSATKAARYRGGGENGGGGRGVGVTLCCAVAAGMLSSLASQPGDSLLSTLNNEGRSSRRDSSSGEGGRFGGSGEPVAFAMARIAREAGFFGLFRGTSTRMMHVTSIVTVQLLIYQSVKRMVGISS